MQGLSGSKNLMKWFQKNFLICVDGLIQFKRGKRVPEMRQAMEVEITDVIHILRCQYIGFLKQVTKNKISNCIINGRMWSSFNLLL